MRLLSPFCFRWLLHLQQTGGRGKHERNRPIRNATIFTFHLNQSHTLNLSLWHTNLCWKQSHIPNTHRTFYAVFPIWLACTQSVCILKFVLLYMFIRSFFSSMHTSASHSLDWRLCRCVFGLHRACLFFNVQHANLLQNGIFHTIFISWVQ